MANVAIGDNVRARRRFSDGTYEWNYGYVTSHTSTGQVEMYFTDGTTDTFSPADLAF